VNFYFIGSLKDGEALKAHTPLFKRPFGCAGKVLSFFELNCYSVYYTCSCSFSSSVVGYKTCCGCLLPKIGCFVECLTVYGL